jgi:hypothetical protein
MDLGCRSRGLGGEFSEVLNKMLDQQKSLVLRFQIDYNDKGYTLQLNNNLFQPPSEQTLRVSNQVISADEKHGIAD